MYTFNHVPFKLEHIHKKVKVLVMNRLKFDSLNLIKLKPIVSFVLLLICHDIEDTRCYVSA